MPDYLQYRVQGGTYFFTVNLLERRLDTVVRHIDVLRDVVRFTKQERPFHINAWVVLPGHMYSTAGMQEAEQRMEQLPSIWTLPPGDDDFSNLESHQKPLRAKTSANERSSRMRTDKNERGGVATAFLITLHLLLYCYEFCPLLVPSKANDRSGSATSHSFPKAMDNRLESPPSIGNSTNFCK